VNLSAIFSGFLDTIIKGGPAMWALLLLSIIAVAIVIERLLFFASQHSDSKGLLRAIGQKIAADDLNGAIKICQQNKGMLPRSWSSACSAARRTAPTSPTRSRSR
jgi:biopolymer transport protein ExbB/TolQ